VCVQFLQYQNLGRRWQDGVEPKRSLKKYLLTISNKVGSLVREKLKIKPGGGEKQDGY